MGLGSFADSPSELAKKKRAAKDGARPLGRPKMRNPDGSLVHPPRLPKVRKPVLLSPGMSVATASPETPSQTPASTITVKKVSDVSQFLLYVDLGLV
jgi:hypothetical protein